VLERLNEEREPIVITQNGEAKAVLVDVRTYEQSQETMALLKILAIADKEIESGETVPIEDVMKEFGIKVARS
jgi:prevent-host-death family protein